MAYAMSFSHLLLVPEDAMKELFHLLLHFQFRALFLTPTQNIWIQLLRYGFVGGVAFLADFSTLALLHHVVHCNQYLAAAIAFAVGLLVNYLLSKWAVFQQAAQQGKVFEFISYAVIGILGLGLTEGIIWLLHEQFAIAVLAAKAIAAVIVLLWNFLARRL